MLLERSSPNEYDRAAREITADSAEGQPIPFTIVFETGGKTMKELLDFDD